MQLVPGWQAQKHVKKLEQVVSMHCEVAELEHAFWVQVLHAVDVVVVVIVGCPDMQEGPL